MEATNKRVASSDAQQDASASVASPAATPRRTAYGTLPQGHASPPPHIKEGRSRTSADRRPRRKAVQRDDEGRGRRRRLRDDTMRAAQECGVGHLVEAIEQDFMEASVESRTEASSELELAFFAVCSSHTLASRKVSRSAAAASLLCLATRRRKSSRPACRRAMNSGLKRLSSPL